MAKPETPNMVMLRDVSRRGATRFHVACADADGNVELFMQAGFARYGDEMICFRGVDRGRRSAGRGARRPLGECVSASRRRSARDV